MVDILEREGDSEREDRTRATTWYWPGSAHTRGEHAARRAGQARRL